MLGSLKKACAPAIAAVGGVLAIGSRIFDGKDMAELGLPFWAWEVIGAGIFFIAIGTIVVGVQRRIEELNQDSQVPSPHIGGESVFGTKDNPIIPEATLHIYIGAHDFGTSAGEEGSLMTQSMRCGSEFTQYSTWRILSYCNPFG